MQERCPASFLFPILPDPRPLQGKRFYKGNLKQPTPSRMALRMTSAQVADAFWQSRTSGSTRKPFFDSPARPARPENRFLRGGGSADGQKTVF